MRSLLLVSTAVLFAATTVSADQTKSRRYYDQLRQRPGAGTLFDRFVDAWQEDGTLDSLQTFLTTQAASPGSTAADYRLLALLHVRRSDDKAALDALHKAAELGAGNADVALEEARVQYRLLDFEAVLKTAEVARDHIELAKLRARALLRLNRQSDALKVWQEMLAAHAEDQDLADDLTELLVEEGMFDEAAANARKLIARTTDAYLRSVRQLRLGDILSRSQHKDDAVAVFEDVLSAAGQDSWIEDDVLAKLDAVYRREDDVSALVGKLESLAAKHPQRVRIALMLARSQAEQGEKDKAIATFRALIEKNPLRPELRESFLDLLAQLRRIPDAIEQAEALRAARPQDKELLVRLIALHHESKDPAAVSKAIAEYLALPGTNESDHLRIARMQGQWLEHDAALRTLETALAKYPNTVPLKDALAAHLVANDQKDRGLQLYRDIVQKGSLEDAIRTGQALLLRGETRAAQDMLAGREQNFAQEPRFLAVLIQAALANKDFATAQRLARARLLLVFDSGEITNAVRQCIAAQPDDKALQATLAELRGRVTPPIQERLLLAALLEQTGKQEDAERVLLAAGDADLKLALPVLIAMHTARLEFAKAIAVAGRLLALPSQHTAANVQKLVQLNRQANAPAKAMALIPEWKKLAPNATAPWTEEAKLLLEQGKISESLDVLRAAMRKFDKDQGVAAEFARTALSNGKPDEAMAVYLRLYELSEDAADRLRYVALMAEAAQYTGKLPALIDRFKERQRSNRGSAIAWLALGQLYLSSGDDEQRRLCLYEASRLRPQDLSLLTQIARIEEESGLFDASLRTLEAAAKLDPTSKTKEAIARHHIQHGDADTGYEMIFQIAGGDKADARSLEQMADALAEAGEWKRAANFLSPHLDRFSDDYRLRYLHAVALEESEQRAEATEAFVALLGMTKEMPGVVVQPVQRPGVGYEEPPGLAEWRALGQFFYLAHDYRQKQPGSGWRGYRQIAPQAGVQSPFPPTFVGQPPQVTLLGAFALCHLHEMAADWSKEQRSALAQRLTKAGIESADMLLELTINQGLLTVDEGTLNAHPEDLRLHALWLGTNSQRGSDTQRLEHCFDLFHEKYRSLALQAAFVAIEDSPRFQKELPAFMRQFEEPNYRDWGWVAGVVSNRDSTLDDRLKNEFTDILETWAQQIDREKAERGSLDSSVLSCQIATHRWEKVLRAVERQATTPPKAQAASSSNAAFNFSNRFGWRGIAEFYPQPLTCPVQSLDLQPAALLNFGNTAGEESPQAGDDEMIAGIGPLLPTVKHDGLRALLEMKYTDHAGKSLEALIKQRLTKPSPIVADEILTAWFHQYAGRYTVACAHLLKARAITTDTIQQRFLDNALLWNATRLGSDALASDSKLTASLKETVGRIAASATQPGSIEQIVPIASQLGFADLAESLAKQSPRFARSFASGQNPSPPAANPYSQNFTHQRRQQAPRGPDAVIQLLDKGQREQALKELTTQFALIGDQWLDGQNYSNAAYTLRNLREQVAKKDAKLNDDALAALAAQAGEQARRLAQLAALHDLRHANSDAIALYEKALAAGLKSPQAELRLRVLKSGDDPREMAAWLLKLPATTQDQLLQRLFQERDDASDERDDVASRLRIAKLATALMSDLAAHGKRLPQNFVRWFVSMPQLLANSGTAQKKSFGGLWEIREPGPGNGEVLAFPAELRQAHNDVCNALTHFPETADAGFAPLAGKALQEDGDPTNIYELATDILRRSKPGAVANWSSPPAFQSQRRIAMPSPAMFVTAITAATRGMDAVEKDVLPLIRQARGRPEAEDMRAYARVLTAANGDFAAAARAWVLPKGVQQRQSPQALGDGGRLGEVLRVREEGMLTASLDDLLLASMKQGSYFNISDDAARYVTSLKMADGAEAVRTFVRKVRDLALGSDVPKRAAAIAGYYERQNERQQNRQPSMTQQQSDQRTGTYLNWLRQITDLGNGLALLPCVKEDGLLDQQGWMNNWPGDFRRTFAGARGRAGIDWWIEAAEGLDLLSGPEFRLYQTSPDSTNTILSRMLEALPDRDKVAARLKDRPTKTLGVDLCIVMLTRPRSGVVTELDKTRWAMLAEALKKHPEDIAAMSEVARRELDAFLREQFPAYSRTTDPDLAKAVAPIRSAVEARDSAELEVILSAASWDDLPNSLRQPSSLAHQLHTLALRDRAKAADVLRKAFALIKRSRDEIASKARGDTSPASLPSGYMLASMAQVPQLLPEIISEAEECGLMSSQRWVYQLSGALCDSDGSLQQPGDLQAVFDHMPWMNEADTFADWPLSDSWSPSVLAKLIAQLSVSQRSDQMEELRRLVYAAPRTFGQGLLQALIAGHAKTASGEQRTAVPLMEFLSKRDDLAKLSPAAAAIVLSIADRWSGSHRKVPAELISGAWRHTLEASAVTHFSNEADRLLATAKLVGNEDDVTSAAMTCLTHLAAADNAKALLLLDHVSALQQAADQRRQRLGVSKPAPHETSPARWLQSTLKIPELHAAAFQRLTDLGATQDAQWTYNAMRSALFDGSYELKAEQLIKILRAIGWLGSAAEFNPWLNPTPAGKQNEPGSLLASWLKSDQPARLGGALAAAPEKSFGAELLRSICPKPRAIAGQPTRRFLAEAGSNLPKWTATDVQALLAKPAGQRDAILQLVGPVVGSEKLRIAYPDLRDYSFPGNALDIAASRELVAKVIKSYRDHEPDPTRQTTVQGVEVHDGKNYLRVSYGQRDYGRIGEACGKLYLSPDAGDRKAVKDLLQCISEETSGENGIRDDWMIALPRLCEEAMRANAEIFPLLSSHAAGFEVPNFACILWSSALGTAFVASLSDRTAAGFASAYAAFGYASDVQHFPFLMDPKENGKFRILQPFDYLLKRLAKAPEQERAAIQKSLGELRPRSFGADLLSALLTSRVAYEQVLKEHETEIAKLPAGARTRLSQAGYAAFPVKKP